MRFRNLLIVCQAVSLCIGCGPKAPAAKAPPSTTISSVNMQAPPDDFIPTHQVDPVASGLAPGGITTLCDEHLKRAKTILDGIVALEKEPIESLSWDNTVARFDDIILELSIAGSFPYLMSEAHPDAAVREAAKTCEPKVDQFRTDIMLNPQFANVIKRYAERKEPLLGVRARLLRELIRDFHRNGLDLPPEKQTRLREINDELTKLSQEFSTNISNSVSTIKVSPSQLKGLPQPFIDGHKPGDDGLVTLNTNYPDYFPVITYCDDRTVARDLTAKFDNRAADENMPLLARVLALRNEKAKLLGYDTWADYAIEPRMAKTKATVKKFLEQVSKEVRQTAMEDYWQFDAEHRKLGNKPLVRIPNYDRLYVEQRLRSRKYGYDAKLLSEYFEVDSVARGIIAIAERMYDIRLELVTSLPTWHPDVRAYQVMHGGRVGGVIYLDLHPRDGKYKHAAMFDIRPGKDLGYNRYLAPSAALLCNFPKPGDAPALMAHSDVVTFFHEFGHALHHVLTRQPLATYSGTNTARDFVEAPSQMFEEWAFRREILDTFARHYKTNELIPEELYQGLIRSRTFGRGLHTERQVSLATLDLAYHTTPVPFDTDKVFTEVMGKTQRFAYLPNTHFQASFGHLMGYDAGYYGYQWALALAADVLTRFEKEGFTNPLVSEAWRREVLEQGAGEDENKLIENFLGRPHNLDAYGRFLRAR